MAERPLYTSSFNAEQYAKSLFVKEEYDKSQSFLNLLNQKKANAARELKDSVVDNYHTFITASREIEKMEAEMLDLRTSLHDANSVLNKLNELSLDLSRDMPAAAPLDTEAGQGYSDDVRFLAELDDDLEVAISERQFAAAVEQIQRGHETLAQIEDPQLSSFVRKTRAMLEGHVKRLVALFAKELQNPTLKKGDVRQVLDLLYALGKEAEAREIFLQSRSDMIRREVRRVPFEGDIVLYITELSQRVFSAIAATLGDFEALSASDPRAMSGFMVWVVREIEAYAVMFDRQVFGLDAFQIVAECLAIARKHCDGLEAYGISLTFHLTKAFHPQLSRLIESHLDRMRETVNKQLSTEMWVARELALHDDRRGQNIEKLWLTASAKSVFSLTLGFAREISAISSDELYASVISVPATLFEWYLSFLKQVAVVKAQTLNGKQRIAIMANAKFLVKDLIPRATKIFKRRFQRPIPELERIRERFEPLHSEMMASFCGLVNIQGAADFHIGCYVEISEFQKITAEASKTIHGVVSFVEQLRTHAQKVLQADSGTLIAQPLVASAVRQFAAGRGQISLLTKEGAAQLLVDLFFLELTGQGRLVSPDAQKEIAALISEVGVQSAGLLSADEARAVAKRALAGSKGGS